MAADVIEVKGVCYPRTMDGDEIYRALGTVLKRSMDADERSSASVAGLQETVDLLIRILAGKGLLNEGHQRLLAKVREKARAERPKVRLRLFVDKYQQPNSPIDCEKRIHLCHGRCCAFTVELSMQDLDERALLWEVEAPYLLRHEADGYCSHMDRGKRSCGVYHNRPASCREYDCRTDQRVWLDFEKMIPAPMPEGLSPPARSPA
jgi:hypothetical protein